MEKQNEDQESKLVCVTGNYKIYADRYQFILRDKREEKTDKEGKLRVGDATYHSNLSDILQEIIDRELKDKVAGSKDLSTVIKRLADFQAETDKLLSPLKKLERVGGGRQGV